MAGELLSQVLILQLNTARVHVLSTPGKYQLRTLKSDHISLPGHGPSTCKWASVGLWGQRRLTVVSTKRVNPGEENTVSGLKSCWTVKASRTTIRKALLIFLSTTWEFQRHQTCCPHFQWQPAPHQVCFWTAAVCLKRSFRCRFLPCCRLQLCWPGAHTHKGEKTQHKVRFYKPEIMRPKAKSFPSWAPCCWRVYRTPLFTLCLRVAPKNTPLLCP